MTLVCPPLVALIIGLFFTYNAKNVALWKKFLGPLTGPLGKIIVPVGKSGGNASTKADTHKGGHQSSAHASSAALRHSVALAPLQAKPAPAEQLEMDMVNLEPAAETAAVCS